MHPGSSVKGALMSGLLGTIAKAKKSPPVREAQIVNSFKTRQG